MSKTRIVLSLDESAAELLRRQDNASRYIGAIVTRSWGRAMTAFNRLILHGWTCGEMIEALTALNGAWEGIEQPAVHSATMSRHRPVAVMAARWEIMKNEVALNPIVAFALDAVAAEYWCENSYLREIIADGKNGEMPEVDA